MNDENKERINIDDIPKAEEDVTDEEAKGVQGGLLLPAVQKVREAAARSTTDTSTTDDVQGRILVGTD